jgi:uncharacterized membrane protein YjgN (DUF898 family)
MNDNNGRKIDINGSIKDSVSGAASDAFGMAVIALIFGWLIAPFFSYYWENHYRNICKFEDGQFDVESYNLKMFKVKLCLWTICIIGWIAVLLCNIYPAN